MEVGDVEAIENVLQMYEAQHRRLWWREIAVG
jgi:hypothetical protein